MESIDACDESKCVSIFLNEKWHFGCYGGGSSSRPMICADGFLPVVVEDEPWLYGYQYFTCCPPSNHSHSTNITRHCSEPIAVTEEDDAGAMCDQWGDTRRFPRQMKPFERSSKIMWPIICCDNNTTNAMNFLDETECVPYRDGFKYNMALIWENSIGRIYSMTCDDEGFPNPRPIDNGSLFIPHNGSPHGFRPYQCCKNGPAIHFRKDAAFKITVYPPLLLFCLSAMASMVVAIALLVPLLIQLKNGTHRQRSSRVSRRSNTFSTRASFRKQRDSSYSSFNLYLFALAVTDCLYSSLQIGLYGSAISQRFNPRFVGAFIARTFNVPLVDFTITIAYFAANLLINAIVAHQVLELLRSSQQGQRIHQPSLSKAVRQIGAIFTFSTAVGAGLYFLFEVAYDASDTENVYNAYYYSSIALLFLTTVSPLLYVGYVAVLIKCRGYIPPIDGTSAKNKALRSLFFYFVRILAVFYGVWLPGIIMLAVSELSVYRFTTAYLTTITFCLFAIQPIVTSCMILTKSDVRKYVSDLVTLAYIFGRKDKASFDESRSTSFGSSKNRSGKSTRFFDGSDPFGNCAVDPFGVIHQGDENSSSRNDFLGDSNKSSPIDTPRNDSKKSVSFDPNVAIDLQETEREKNSSGLSSTIVEDNPETMDDIESNDNNENDDNSANDANNERTDRR